MGRTISDRQSVLAIAGADCLYMRRPVRGTLHTGKGLYSGHIVLLDKSDMLL